MMSEAVESSVEEVQNEFSVPWPRSDVIFLVEGRPLHSNKTLLSMVSPVFEAMFEQDFKEKTACKVSLPEKKYNDMVEFFRCIHPHINKDVTEKNLEMLLTLADEYQCQMLTEKCRAFITGLVERCQLLNRAVPEGPYMKGNIPGPTILRWLRLTDQFLQGWELLEKVATQLEIRMNFLQLEENDEYGKLSSAALRVLFHTYAERLTAKVNQEKTNNSNLQRKLKTETSEKQLLQRALENKKGTFK